MIFAFLFGLSMDYEVFCSPGRARSTTRPATPTRDPGRARPHRQARDERGARAHVRVLHAVSEPGLDIKQFASGSRPGSLDATVIRGARAVPDEDPRRLELVAAGAGGEGAARAGAQARGRTGVRRDVAALDSITCAGSAGSSPRAVGSTAAARGDVRATRPPRAGFGRDLVEGASVSRRGGSRSSTSRRVTSRSRTRTVRCTSSRTARSTTTPSCARELPRPRAPMRTTHSDTERSCMRTSAGLGFAERLHGMFAIAIWDATRKRLVLARDRFGIKPLYFRDGRRRALVRLRARRAAQQGDLDLDALEAYLSMNCVPGPLSIFREIRKLQPGHV